MTVKIGSARIDESGKASGGRAGDQTGKEVSIQDWYRHGKGWRVLRCSDSAKAERIATAMEGACANGNIGYDQSERLTLYNRAKEVGFDPAKVKTPCETDCSALVRVCLAYAGIKTDNFITSNEAKAILNTGLFTELTDKKYTDRPDYLLRGDILVTAAKGHTAVVLSDGDKAEKVGVAITGRRVNLRCGNGTNYAVLKTVSAGECFEYVATAENGWLAVVDGDRVAWVSGKYGVRG